MEQIVTEGALAGIETTKRSNTAELRKLFDVITGFLADGYNHKQICEHLNTQGLAIPYPQYRAIMTRLRRERSQSDKERAPPNRPVIPAQATRQVGPLRVTVMPASQVPPDNTSESGQQHAQDKKISWDPMSEVKWK